jgi:D-alanyl-D-alanine carboxypeptidase
MKVFADSSVMTRMKRVGPVLAIALLAALSRPSADASADPLRLASSQLPAEAASNAPETVGQHRLTTVPAEVPRPSPPAPRCRVGQRATTRQASVDPIAAVVDTQLALPSRFAPLDLVDTGAAGLNRGFLVSSMTVADLRAMVHAARRDGVRLAVLSAYRSYAEQAVTFAAWAAANGYADALRGSARPGHSEHQLGTALDFRSVSGPAPWTVADWARTAEGAWLRANAWRFGWVMSYPRRMRAESCYDYEPWHYRYVGRSRANLIHAAGVAPRVYLWSLRRPATGGR